MKVAYCDCFSGISGDMFLGALLDAGLPLETLTTELAKLGLPDKFKVTFSQTKKGSFLAGLAVVEIDEFPKYHLASQNSDPHEHTYSNPHNHSHAAGILAGHSHSEIEPHEHAHNQRSMRDIAELIEASELSPKVKATSMAIFTRLAEAEGKIHGDPPDQVHFHEVGAVDSIVDIVGAAIGLNVLGIERLYSSALPLGSGQVKSQHGMLPLPAPATLELLRQANAPVIPSPAQKEMVTPTGAAILATLATFEQPAMRITAVGTGAGQREMPWPNIMRLIVGETGSSPGHQEIVLIETNIDDMSGQGFGQVMNKLFKAGALDVYFTPIFMKKNRPAMMLSVIASRLHEPVLARILFEETTTFGMRVQPVSRYEAQREMRKVITSYGEIDVKLKILDGKIRQAVPEYDICLKIAEETNVPFLDVYQAAMAAGRELT